MLALHLGMINQQFEVVICRLTLLCLQHASRFITMNNERSQCHWPMQGSVTGRLLSYSPKTKKTHVLAGDMFYANGVVVAHDQSFLLVVETMSVTIHKYWLKGPKVHEHVMSIRL